MTCICRKHAVNPFCPRHGTFSASGPEEASCRDDLPGRRESPSPEAESPAAACAERLTSSGAAGSAAPDIPGRRYADFLLSWSRGL